MDHYQQAQVSTPLTLKKEKCKELVLPARERYDRSSVGPTSEVDRHVTISLEAMKQPIFGHFLAKELVVHPPR